LINAGKKEGKNKEKGRRKKKKKKKREGQARWRRCIGDEIVQLQIMVFPLAHGRGVEVPF
jgi:hypothetical protein